jgi:hypothetical protein
MSAAISAARTPEGPTRREQHRPAQIEPDEHGPIALLAKHFGVRLAGARRDAPIHRAQIVAGLIRSRFVELDAAALVRRQVPADRGDAHARRRQPHGLAGRPQAHQVRERYSHGRRRRARGGQRH